MSVAQVSREQSEVGDLETLRRLPSQRLSAVAAEIRAFLVDRVCATGGHLGSNLGAVELTMALHRVFESPRDRILFDTGHQSYVHKMLTGRRDGFARLRQAGGLSGYPSQVESVHDVIENSHASTALSYADGLAKAYELREDTTRTVVAVVGDGALTGGMCWEALNNIGAGGRPVILALNDNGRSYAPTTGALANHLRDLGSAHTAVNLFNNLGLAYIGPIDGHDIEAMEDAFRHARALRRPVVVHCVTVKGRGYLPAEADVADRLHGVGIVDPHTGQPFKASGQTWTDVFAAEIIEIGTEREDIVCVTASMLQPVGLKGFADRFPQRVFDVGIAEQHAVGSAAGLALGGLHPVVALYATFINRAFDQVLMDVALHRLPVTFVLDRAGVTGPDGASHHGMWDLSFLSLIPGLGIAAPRDPGQLRQLLREAVDTTSGPTVVRFPKAAAGADLQAVARRDGVDILHQPPSAQVLIVAVGPTAAECVTAARTLTAAGTAVTVVDPRWIVPVNRAIVTMAGLHRLVLTVEDNSRTGGVGTLIAQAVHDAGLRTAVHNLGLPRRFLPHADRGRLLHEHGFNADAIVQAIGLALSGLAPYQHGPDQPSDSP